MLRSSEASRFPGKSKAVGMLRFAQHDHSAPICKEDASLDKPYQRFLYFAWAVGLGLGLLFLALSLPLLAAPGEETPPHPANPTNPTNPSPPIRAILYLHEQVDLNPFNAIADETARHVTLVEQLQAVADSSQYSLREKLDDLQTDGQIESYRPLWIVNAIAVSGPADVVYKLAEEPEVARIAPDEARPLIQPPQIREGVEVEWLTAVSPTTPTTQPLPWGIERIRAPYVWHGLGVTGQGVTVAIMDSGVDWLHPDLNPNYRGNLPGGVSHLGHWYNAPDPAVAEPFDGLGHGTHVAGTAVGQNGIGVAPGASWIAVNIASPNGLIYDSDIHAGFQWLLAPAGDPALAPDVVNGSWGGPGWLTTYAADIQALHLAGILTVFAAGNSGPDAGSVISPGSLPGVLTIGASDPAEGVAWFSSRGPSPLTNEAKPALVAPGAQVFSALPGGQYAIYNGTSMATPHAAGAAALLLSANPSLSRLGVMGALTETAVSLSMPSPNPDSGWGRLDIYAAVVGQPTIAAGTLQGVVRHNGVPQPDIPVTVTTPGGVELAFRTDGNGRYQAHLQPGLYQLHTAPFGFTPANAANLLVQAGQTTGQDLNLTRLPSGVLNISVREAISQKPVQATVTILGTPISQPVNAEGNATFLLPAGSYDLQVSKVGYRLVTLTVIVPVNGARGVAVNLTESESILLVDSGPWYYQSYADYYRRALINLGHAFDDWPITTPFDGLPTAAEMAGYDVVIWSSPFDSPGYIWGGEAVMGYLRDGGKLLISGQNAGFYDGAVFFEPWWYTALQADYLGKTTPAQPISGAEGTLFEGLTISLNGADSAQNQGGVDQSAPWRESLTGKSFVYEDGQAAGLTADQCHPSHLAYLGFGLEGVSGAANREAVLQRTLAYFQAPEIETGARWLPKAIDDLAPPDGELTYRLRLRNLSETLTDTFSLEMADAPWPAVISPTVVSIPSCKTAVLTLTLSIPADLPLDVVYEWGITAISQANPTTQAHLPLRHKTPGRILLVDDDRWYDQEAVYQSALEQAGFAYDYWNVGWRGEGRGSPSAALLKAYDFVIWFTGYDWFQPVTPAENVALTAYLAQGGRLFLSSQDFLYYHHRTPLARDYLGVIAYQESITPTQAYAGHPALPPEAAGPLPLVFNQSFRNHSDGLVPAPAAEPFLWHDAGALAGLAANGAKMRPVGMERPFRAIFWGIPFEKTPTAIHPTMIQSVLGWLSDLGDSSFVVDRPVGAMGETRQYTITLRNGPAAPNQTSLTNTLPVELDFVAFVEAGGATYDPAARQVRWSGLLPEDGERTISYLAAPQADLPPGAQIKNDLEIAYDRHALRFGRTAVFWLETPDLRGSQLAVALDVGRPTQFFTYTLTLVNEGLVAAGVVTAVLRLPEPLYPLTDTLQVGGGTTALSERRVVWQTSLLPGQSVSLTLALTRPMSADGPDWLSAAAYVEDGVSPPLVVGQFSYAPPYRFYLPIIARH